MTIKIKDYVRVTPEMTLADAVGGYVSNVGGILYIVKEL